MIEKKKKRLIISGIIVGALVFVLLLSSTIFQIRSVSVEYQTTLSVLTKEDLDRMITEADFPIGKSIFFAKFDENISVMEKAYPYAKISGVERKFPNSLVVYVAERVPAVRYNSGGVTYILDADLKVLNKLGAGDVGYKSVEVGLPLITIEPSVGENIDTAQKEVGDFLLSAKLKAWVKGFYEGAVCTPEGKTEAISCIKLIESITVRYSTNLDKIEFKLTYTGEDVVSTITGEEELSSTVYKIISALNEASNMGKEYEYINASGGVVYAKEKTQP